MKLRKNIAVMAIFNDEIDVKRTLSVLKQEGFRDTDISVLIADSSGNRDFKHSKESKAPEGAATGAVAGASVGASLGLMLSAGTIVIPGIGPFIAAGPILGLLAGMGAGGTVGGITGALIGAGIPEYEAKRYEGLVNHGRALISVHCDDADWAKHAENVLERCGGEDISSRREAKPESEIDSDLEMGMIKNRNDSNGIHTFPGM